MRYYPVEIMTFTRAHLRISTLHFNNELNFMKPLFLIYQVLELQLSVMISSIIVFICVIVNLKLLKLK